MYRFLGSSQTDELLVRTLVRTKSSEIRRYGVEVYVWTYGMDRKYKYFVAILMSIKKHAPQKRSWITKYTKLLDQWILANLIISNFRLSIKGILKEWSQWQRWRLWMAQAHGFPLTKPYVATSASEHVTCSVTETNSVHLIVENKSPCVSHTFEGFTSRGTGHFCSGLSFQGCL